MKCRIGNIVPLCGYRIEGVSDIWLLDFEDFRGLRFKGGKSYSCGLVSVIQREGVYTPVDSPNTAKYSSSLLKGVYTHTIETFIGELSAEMQSRLHLSTKRRYVVVFRAKSGRYFVFGHDSGATVNYTSQTSDGCGSLVTVSGFSRYPLFESLPSVLSDEKPWVLDDGTWSNQGVWYNKGTFKY